LPTKSAIGGIKHSFQLYFKSSLEKKLVIVAYPLTVLLIYVLFTSTFVVTSFKNFFQSIQKSLRKAKAEDETVIRENIDVDAERWNVVYDSQLVEQIALAKAKKDIEAKLFFILQDELKAKSLRSDKAAKLNLVNNEYLDDSLVPALLTEVALDIEEINPCIVAIQGNKVARSKKEFRTEDFTVAFFVLLCVGSPFLQVIQQHMIST
jgi:hypothetical protein